MDPATPRQVSLSPDRRAESTLPKARGGKASARGYAEKAHRRDEGDDGRRYSR